MSAIRALDDRMINGPAIKVEDGKSDLFSELKRMASKNKRRQGKLTNG